MSYEGSPQEWQRVGLTRRRLLRRAAELSAVSTLPALLVACGDDDDDSSSSSDSGGSSTTPKVEGTITLLTYPDWIGDKEVERFEKKYPDASVKEVADTSSGAAATVALLSRSKGDYDIVLGRQDDGHAARGRRPARAVRP